MATERLYYHDSYVRKFRARVVDKSPDFTRVYLDRTAFYPSSGGQPFDTGALDGVRVVDVVDEDNRIAHVLERPLAGEAGEVTCAVDWARRFDHMQQHTGQHLLSAVLAELFDAPTVSFHMGPEVSTIDIAHAAFTPEEVQRALLRANEIVCENRRVAITFEGADGELNLRKASARTGTLRVITIADLDRSACGGTHVRATGEIGPILIRKLDRVRGNVRVEFVCGLRAVRRAAADYETLSAAARAFSSPLEDVPALVATLRERAQDSEKAMRKLSVELGQARGRELYGATQSRANGRRVVLQRVRTIDEQVRAEAQAFAAGERAVFAVISEEPVTLLVAASADSGVHAGDVVRKTVAALGGRGGGSAAMAQGSVTGADAYELVRALKAVLDPPAIT